MKPWECICYDCMRWWQKRCPYGGCYDDKRAIDDPYDKAHPNDPPRTAHTKNGKNKKGRMLNDKRRDT